MESIKIIYDSILANPLLLILVIVLAIDAVYQRMGKGAAILKRLAEFDELFKKLEQLFQEEHGDPRRHYDLAKSTFKGISELQEQCKANQSNCMEHFQDTDKLRDKSLYSRCPIDECPAFQKTQLEYEGMKRSLEATTTAVLTNRETFNERLKSIDSKTAENTKAITDLSVEIIANMRATKNGK